MGAGGSHTRCEEYFCRDLASVSEEGSEDEDHGDGLVTQETLCIGMYGVPKPSERLVVSEDLPFFVPGCSDAPPPSRWRRFVQKHRRAPRVPPLRLPIRKGTPSMTTPKTTPKMAKQTSNEAASLSSSTRCHRRAGECLNPTMPMPRLPRSARLQSVRKGLTGVGNRCTEAPVQNVGYESMQGVWTSGLEFNVGEDALEAAPVKPRQEEGVWVDVELESARLVHAPIHSVQRVLPDGSLSALPTDRPEVADEEPTPLMLNLSTSAPPWSLGSHLSVGNSSSSSHNPDSQATDLKQPEPLKASMLAESNALLGLALTADLEAAVDSENQDPNIQKREAALPAKALHKSSVCEDVRFHPAWQPTPAIATYEDERLESSRQSTPRNAENLPEGLQSALQSKAGYEELRARSVADKVGQVVSAVEVLVEEGAARKLPRSTSCLPFDRKACTLSFDESERLYQPWSDSLTAWVSQECKMAMWVTTPEVLTFFLASDECDSMCSTRPPSSDGAGSYRSSDTLGDTTDRAEYLFLTLAEVADRPFSVELLMLSTAFARLVGTGAGETTRRPVTVNARHHEVEALLLKYTALASRRDLRAELEAWFPGRTRLASLLRCRARGKKSQGAPNSDRGARSFLPPLALSTEGPDDAGPSLCFEALAAFITTHAAPQTVLTEAFTSMSKLHDQPFDNCSATFVPRRVARQGLEAALVPLLAGLPATAAGNGRVAAHAARRIASRAAVVAIRGHDRSGRFVSRQCDSSSSLEAQLEDGNKHWLGFEEFVELFGKTASIARLCMMHLTGDTKRWQNCIASPSPRVDLRCSMGGG